MSTTLRIAGIIRDSIVDGPGFRFVVFTQGCPHGCFGCHNPESHDFQGGYDCSLDKILQEIDKNPLLRGVTFSGGEPFCQPKPLVELGQQVKDRGLTLMIYTGYRAEELLKMGGERPELLELLKLADIVVDGPYLEEQKDLNLLFRGSRNQRVLSGMGTVEAGKPIEIEFPQ